MKSLENNRDLSVADGSVPRGEDPHRAEGAPRGILPLEANPENKKILILALSGIGNFLMQSPVFRTIKQVYPTSHITVWVAPRGTKVLAENNPYIDEIIEEPIKRSLLEHIGLIQRLRRQKFDIGIVLFPGQLLKSALYLYLAGIPRRLGHKYPLLSNSASSFLLTNPIEEREDLHDIEQNLNLLASRKVVGAKYDFSIPSSAQTKARSLLTQLHIPKNKSLVGFHLGSAPSFEWKRWPLENFVAIGKQLVQQRNAHILLFGGPDEKNLKNAAKIQLGADATSIETDLIVTAAIMQHCALFLSNDSGLMHLAAASGVKTIGLFGPTDEQKTGPRAKNALVIRSPGTKPVYDTNKNYSPSATPHKSLYDLTVQTVLKAL